MIRRSNRGAVLAEFAVALMPLLLCYFVFTQIAQLYIGNLLFKHAANVAARAAVVINQPELNPGDNGTAADVTDAAKAALAPYAQMFSNVHTSSTEAGEQYGLVTTTTTADFNCGVPLGRTIVCPNGKISMTQDVALPLQGARYKLE